MTDLRTAAQQALEALYQAREFTELYDTQHAAAVNERCHENIAALRAALAQEQPNPPGCEHCNHPLYAATKCRVCGRVTEPKAQEPTPPPEARTEAEKTAYAAGWWDALRKAQQAEPVQEPALPKRGKYRTLDEDILKMAREAWGEDHEIFWFNDDGIARFADIVRADEREACAVAGGAAADAGLDVAAAIRARAQQPDAAIADRLARHGIPMPEGDPK